MTATPLESAHISILPQELFDMVAYNLDRTDFDNLRIMCRSIFNQVHGHWIKATARIGIRPIILDLAFSRNIMALAEHSHLRNNKELTVALPRTSYSYKRQREHRQAPNDVANKENTYIGHVGNVEHLKLALRTLVRFLVSGEV